MGSVSRKAPVGIEPYTSSVETWTKRRTPVRRAASSRTAVPTTSVLMNSDGSRMLRLTWLSAARLTTASTPSMASATAAASAMSACTKR